MPSLVVDSSVVIKWFDAEPYTAEAERILLAYERSQVAWRKYMTERAQYSFTIKTYPDGTPWIYLERVAGDDVSILPADGFLGLDFQEGVSWEEAVALKDALNENIAYLTYTKASRDR